ncbi:hypothetical protein DYB37_012995, partial [Aphanomyces astaci]
NTGLIHGQETVLLFGTPPATRVTAETKLLKRYTKLSLAAGEAKVVTFSLSHQDLGYYSNDIGNGLKKDAPSGTYTFFVKHDTDCTATSNQLCMALNWDNPTQASFSPTSTSNAVASVDNPAAASTPSSPVPVSPVPVSPVPVSLIVGLASGVGCALVLMGIAYMVRRKKQQRRRGGPPSVIDDDVVVMESKEQRHDVVLVGGV